MSNVDAQELARFDNVAARWWDMDGPFRPLHELNPQRLAFIAERQPLAGSRIVDIGCGGGIMSEALARAGADVVAIDLAPEALDVARLHALDVGVRVDYRLQSAEDLAAEMPGQFDAVSCLEMLEHVPDPESTVRACARLVAPGGWVFFSTINRNPKSFLFAIVGAEHVLQMLPKGTHEYARFIRPSELGRWCRDAGLDASGTRGLEYNPLTRRYWMSNDTSVNYLVACRKSA